MRGTPVAICEGAVALLHRRYTNRFFPLVVDSRQFRCIPLGSAWNTCRRPCGDCRRAVRDAWSRTSHRYGSSGNAQHESAGTKGSVVMSDDGMQAVLGRALGEGETTEWSVFLGSFHRFGWCGASKNFVYPTCSLFPFVVGTFSCSSLLVEPTNCQRDNPREG